MNAEALGSTASVGDYLQLLKPRVMSLVVFTAFVGLTLAPGTVHPWVAAVAILCILIGAGAAGALNMWYDADIDALMATREFFDYLPLSNRHDIPERPCADPWDRLEESLDTLIPPSANQPYDMHELIRKVADEGDFFELQPAHAANIITGKAERAIM